MLRFLVKYEDTFGDPNFIGYATFPVGCLRKGYRSVQLKNNLGEDLYLASLLVNINITPALKTISHIAEQPISVTKSSDTACTVDSIGDIDSTDQGYHSSIGENVSDNYFYNDSITRESSQSDLSMDSKAWILK